MPAFKVRMLSSALVPVPAYGDRPGDRDGPAVCIDTPLLVDADIQRLQSVEVPVGDANDAVVHECHRRSRALPPLFDELCARCSRQVRGRENAALCV